MPGTPVPVDQQLLARFADIERRLTAVERSQQLVFTDPTGATGDPAHGHAVAVIGNLSPICGITPVPTFGIASYKTGSWVQL